MKSEPYQCVRRIRRTDETLKHGRCALFPFNILNDNDHGAQCRESDDMQSLERSGNGCPCGLFSNSVPALGNTASERTHVATQDMSSDDDSLSSVSLDEQAPDYVSMFARRCLKHLDNSDNSDASEFLANAEYHASASGIDDVASAPSAGQELSLDHSKNCHPQRKSRGENPWITASRTCSLRKKTCQESLELVAPELRVACDAVLLREHAHPARRMSDQVLNTLLGAPSPLTGEILRNASIFTRESIVLPRLVQVSAIIATKPSFVVAARNRAQALLTFNEIQSLSEQLFGESLFAKPPPLDAILHRAVLCGQLYTAILSFVNAYEGGHIGVVLQSVARFVDTFLQQYEQKIFSCVCMDDMSLENVRGDLRSAYEVSPWLLLIEAEDLRNEFLRINELLISIEKTAGSGCEIIDICFNAASEHYNDQTLYRMFVAATMPYFRFLWDWSFNGAYARDTKNEFFGTPCLPNCDGCRPATGSDSVTRGFPSSRCSEAPRPVHPCLLNRETAHVVLRCGQARALLGRLCPKHPLLNIAFPDCEKHMADTVSIDTLQQLTESVMSFASSAENCVHGNWFVDEADNVDACDDSQECKPRLSPSAPGGGNLQLSFNHDTGSKLGQIFALPRDDGGSGTAVRCFEEQPKGELIRHAACSTAAFHEFWSPEVNRSAFRDVPAEALNLFANTLQAPFSTRSLCFERDWPPLPDLISSLAIEPIVRVNAVIQRQVFLFFVEQVKVMIHLEKLWKFALLGAGDFAFALVESIDGCGECPTAGTSRTRRSGLISDAQLTQRQNRRNRLTTLRRVRLAQCLSAALSMCGADADPHVRRFSIDVGDEDSEQTDFADGGSVVDCDDEHGIHSAHNLWEGDMKVRYITEFPLDLVITPGVLARFSVFFNFFLKIRRAERCCRRLFMTFCRQRSLRTNSINGCQLSNDAQLCSRVWRFCWEAQHFVRIVGDYEATQVVSLSWKTLVSRYEEMLSDVHNSDVWCMRQCVHDFLDDAARRALLEERQQNVLRVILSALDIVVQLDDTLRRAVASGVGCGDISVDAYVRDVNLCIHNLQRRSKFLVAILQQLVARSSTQEHQHFCDLLIRFNYNNFYGEEYRVS